MLKAIFGSKALLGAASAGVLAVGSGAVALSGNAAEPVQPAKIEQASMQLAEVDTARSYSYEEALAESAKGVVLYAAEDIYGAEDVAWDVRDELQIYAEAVPGNPESGSVRLLFLGEDHGVFTQRDMNRGRLGSKAFELVKSAKPDRLSALTAQPN